MSLLLYMFEDNCCSCCQYSLHRETHMRVMSLCKFCTKKFIQTAYVFLLTYSQNGSVLRRKLEEPLAQIRGDRARDPFNSNASRYKVRGKTAASDAVVSCILYFSLNCGGYIVSFMCCIHLVPAPSETCWFRGMSVGGSFRRV